VQKVAGALVMRDRLLIHEIERVTELEFLQVKNSLLVLIQHNLVSFVEEYELGNRENVQTYYQANVALMLWRLRFPRFLQVAKHRFGEEVHTTQRRAPQRDEPIHLQTMMCRAS
jgi:hypothetical protein